MIVTGAIIGAVSFGIQAYNSWSTEKNARKMHEAQEAFQRAALMQNIEEARIQLETMMSVKREITQEERSNQLELMHNLHKENLRSIEYLTSLDRWPLAVMPLVMRDDNLFFEVEDEGVVPINIIFGPCRDRNFQLQIWKQVEEELAIRFATYWNTTSTHPILFYQDAWKDDHEQADSTMCANIHEKIPHTPTIVIAPLINKKGLQIELTHWCIDGIDPNISYKKDVRVSLDGCCHKYERDESYEESLVSNYVNELADLIEGVLGYFDDQYMWLRYDVIPQFPLILQNRISIDDEGRGLLYGQYVDMLKSSLSNGHVNVVADLQLVLAYCKLIDSFGMRHDAFDLVNKLFYGKNLLGDLRTNTPAYEVETLVGFLEFCRENQKTIELEPGRYHDMRCGMSLVKLNCEGQKRYLEDGAHVSNAKAKHFILSDGLLDEACRGFQDKSEMAIMEVLGACREQAKETDVKRDWCHSRYMEKLNALLSETIEIVLSEIDKRSMHFIENIAVNNLGSAWDEQKNDPVWGVKAEDGDTMREEDTKLILSSAHDSILGFARSKAIECKHDYWKNCYLKGSIDKRVFAYCKSVLYGWIEYHIFHEDIIHDSLSDEAKSEIRTKMEALQAMIRAVANNYMDLVFTNHDEES